MSKKKIMVVEDERIIAEDLKMMLENFGYEVVCVASNGQQAIDSVMQYNIDLVTMDINLGEGMDGLETAKRLFKEHDIPIVFISAYANDKIFENAKVSSPYGYLIKPFIEKELKAALEIIFYKIDMEFALKASEKKYRNIFENIQDIYIETDPKGIITEISPSVEKIFQYPSKEVIGKPLRNFCRNSSEADKYLEQVLLKGSLSIPEIDIHNMNGDTIVCSVQAACERDNYGKPVKVIAALHDITEVELAKQNAETISKQWEITFNSISDMVSIFNKDCEIVRVNQAFADFFKKQPEDFAGTKCYEVIHNTNEQLPTCPLSKSLQTKKSTSLELYESQFKKFFEFSVSPILDNNDEITGFVHTIKDISERKRSEKTLLELKKAVETMQMGVTISDISGTILYVNAAEAFMHGYSVSGLLGKDIGIFCKRGNRKQLKKEEINQLKGKVRESTNIHKNGNEFPVRLISDVIRDENGEPFAVVTTCEDITELKNKDLTLINLKKAIETIKLGVTISDVQGKIIYTNHKDAEMHGYEVSDMVGKDIGLFSSSDLRKPMTKEQILKLNGLSRESINIRSNGSTFPVRLMSDVVKDEKDNPIGVITICEDITQQKIAEEEIMRLAAIVESSEDAIIGETLDGTIISWNSGAEKIFGYTSCEVKGKSLAYLAPADRKDEYLTFTKELIQGHSFEKYTTVRVTKSGKKIMVSLTVSPVYDVTGKLIGTSTIARDITESIKNENAVLQAKERLDIILHSIAEGVLVIDSKQNVIIINDKAGHLLGNGFDELSGVHIKEMLINCEDKGKQFLSEIKQSSFITSELKVITPEKRELFVLGSSFEDIDGLTAGNVFILRDVTKMNEIDRLKNDFISSVSHELRTPLTSILGFSGTILRRKNIPEETKTEFLEIIEKESKRLSILIEDLLNISKIETGKNSYSFNKITPSETIKDALEAIKKETD